MAAKELRRTYSPNYFSIEYILACQTLIPCRTEINLPKFGFLVPDCQSQDLPAGVTFQLPLWAARVMAKPLRTHISVNLPQGFKEPQKEVIMEDEGVKTDLRKIHEQYFEVGHLCTSLYHEDAGDLAEIIPEVLQQRILSIGGTVIPYPPPYWASKTWNDQPIPIEFMDLLELKIFQDAVCSSKNILQWLEPIKSIKSS